MTWWVINCPGAAPGPAPRSLFLLYDKKERRNHGAAGINYGIEISSLLWNLLPSHSFQLPESESSSLSWALELIFAKPFGKELGKCWGMPPMPFTAKYEGHSNSALSAA